MDDLVLITPTPDFTSPEAQTALGRAYAALEEAKPRGAAAVEMPEYETAFIRDGCVFLVVEKKRLDSDGLTTDFLAPNGFELVGSENGFLLYSSRPGDDKETWFTWEAAWAFLARE